VRRARIVRILYRPNDEKPGEEGWVQYFGIDDSGGKVYSFYPDAKDACYPLKEGEFEYTSDRER